MKRTLRTALQEKGMEIEWKFHDEIETSSTVPPSSVDCTERLKLPVFDKQTFRPFYRKRSKKRTWQGAHFQCGPLGQWFLLHVSISTMDKQGRIYAKKATSTWVPHVSFRLFFSVTKNSPRYQLGKDASFRADSAKFWNNKIMSILRFPKGPFHILAVYFKHNLWTAESHGAARKLWTWPYSRIRL